MYHFDRFASKHGERFETVKAQVQAAFKQVRHDLKSYARYNYLCCGNCASTALYADYKESKVKKYGAIFSHRQDVEYFEDSGDLYVNFGALCAPDTPDAEYERYTVEFGQKVVAIFKAHGLYTIWDGTRWQRIVIVAQPIIGCEEA